MMSRSARGVEAPEAPAAARVIEALIQAAHGFRRLADARLGGRGLPGGLSAPRMRLLLALKDAAPLRMGDLAASLGISARTVTTLVDALESEGMIARQPHPTDRRATLLDLTPAGRASIDEIGRAQRDLAEEALAALDAAERAQLLSLLNRVAGDRSACGPGGPCGDEGDG
jgi:DNA-binding MarR family transcriptional regulator